MALTLSVRAGGPRIACESGPHASALRLKIYKVSAIWLSGDIPEEDRRTNMDSVWPEPAQSILNHSVGTLDLEMQVLIEKMTLLGKRYSSGLSQAQPQAILGSEWLAFESRQRHVTLTGRTRQTAA